MNLQPVDFKAVAAKGCYVYCYLRHSDSKTATAGSPYYVGIACGSQRHHRPFGHHDSCPIPFDRSLVRVLRSGLTIEEAERWEIFFIAWYGREAEGGVLLNRAKGGRVNAGWKQSEQWVQKHSQRMKGNSHTKGKTISQLHKLAISAANLGRDNATAIKASITSREEQAAARYGISLERFQSLTSKERAAACTRYSRGLRGEELFRSHQKGKSQKTADAKKATAAKKFAIELPVYLQWDQKQLARARYYFNRGLVGAELVAAVA